jgi:flagellar biosynthesis anti-sigma factor FlgM
MNKHRKPRPGGSKPPASHRGKGGQKSEPLPASSAQSTGASGNDALIEQVRQIIAKTPEVRPEKVGPLKEAVEQGTYEIDTRKVANALITKLILDP